MTLICAKSQFRKAAKNKRIIIIWKTIFISVSSEANKFTAKVGYVQRKKPSTCP